MARYEPVIEVRCPICKDEHDERKVEFINIEEDFQGRDVVTFICPSCLTEQKSMRYFLGRC